jgi:transcriptional regulator with XRE-family HTH domain
MLGTVVMEHREKLGISRLTLAEQAGVGPATVSRLELLNKVQHIDVVQRIAEVFGTTAGTLMVEAEDRQRKADVAAKREAARRRSVKAKAKRRS